MAASIRSAALAYRIGSPRQDSRYSAIGMSVWRRASNERAKALKSESLYMASLVVGPAGEQTIHLPYCTGAHPLTNHCLPRLDTRRYRDGNPRKYAFPALSEAFARLIGILLLPRHTQRPHDREFRSNTSERTGSFSANSRVRGQPGALGVWIVHDLRQQIDGRSTNLGAPELAKRDPLRRHPEQADGRDHGRSHHRVRRSPACGRRRMVRYHAPDFSSMVS